MDARRYKIVYEDDAIIVVDKPAGMLVIPTPKAETNTLTHQLNEDLDRRGVKPNVYPCRRLDRETSGLIVYAKGKSIQRAIMEKFKRREVKKRYTAFVHGFVKKNSDIVKTPIYNRKKKRNESALTEYRVLERKKDFTVLEVEPLTGRTNQIRIHLKGIGHPIVGESLFAFRKDFELKFRRTALHAASLEFTHPVTKKKMVFASPLPEDMKNLIMRN